VDAEAAPAKAEHRVELVQLLDAQVNLLRGDTQLFPERGLLFGRLRQEFVQRRIEEPDRRRESLERPENAGEVVALVRQQLGERRFPGVEILSQDHLAYGV